MKKVIDVNFLNNPVSNPELEKYLCTDIHNQIVFNDFACMECYKGNPFKNLLKQLELVSKYPKQVIVLKATRTIGNLKLSSRGFQKRMEDSVQTREFNIFCQNVLRAAQGNDELSRKIINMARLADNHFKKLREDTSYTVKGIEKYKETFTKEQLEELREGPKEFRKRDYMTISLFDKMQKDILSVSYLLYQKHPDISVIPTDKSVRNGYIFRFAICAYLLMIRWIYDGGSENAKASTLLNDSVDMNYAAYATLFDGILTNDKKMKSIYLDACYVLDKLFPA